MAQHINVSGVARKVSKRYERVNGVARNIIKAYTNVSGTARRYFWEKYSKLFRVLGTDNPDRTLHDSFCGVDGETWRFSLHSTGTTSTSDNPHRAVVDISGDLGGKTLEITAKRSATNINDSQSVDAAKVTWWDENGSSTGMAYSFEDSDYTTYTVTIPNDTVAIRIGVWLSSARTAKIELVVTDLKIDGDKLI